MYHVLSYERGYALRLPFVGIGGGIVIGYLRELIDGNAYLVGNRLGERQPYSAVCVGEQQRLVSGEIFADIDAENLQIEYRALIHERRIVRRFAVFVVRAERGAEVGRTCREGSSEIIEIESSARYAVRKVTQEEVIVTFLEVEREVVHRDGIEYVLQKRGKREVRAEVAAGIHTEAYSGHAAVTRFVAYRIELDSFSGISDVNFEHSFGHAYVDVVAFLVEFHAQVEVIQTVGDIRRKFDVRYLGQYHRVAEKRLYDGDIGIDGKFLVGEQYLEQRRIGRRHKVYRRVLRSFGGDFGSVGKRVRSIAARVGGGIAYRQYAFEVIGYYYTRFSHEGAEEAVEYAHEVDAGKRSLEEAQSAEVDVNFTVDVIDADDGFVGKRYRERERGIVEVGKIGVNAQPYREYQHRILRVDIDGILAHSEQVLQKRFYGFELRRLLGVLGAHARLYLERKPYFGQHRNVFVNYAVDVGVFVVDVSGYGGTARVVGPEGGGAFREGIA